VAGHSSQPDGKSAIHALVQCLSALLKQDWGEHAFLGRGTLNIGEISGGIAANVFADRDEATLMLRAVEDPALTEQKLLAHMSEFVRLEHTFKNYAPTEFHGPQGETPIPVAFGTDAPHLRRWGKPLLFGPGHILDAHTEHERISKRDFERAIDTHVRTAHELLQQSQS
jgi:acetylornithine deacetylase